MDSRLCKNIHSFAFIISKAKCRRGVSPIIATLLLVAIATVGGSTVFAFSQDAFSNSQISGHPTIEFIQIIGYDARDGKKIMAHDGINIIPSNCCGSANGILRDDERIAIHIQNNSVQPITISEFRLGGVVYDYTTYSKLGNWNGGLGPQPKEYVIMTGSDGMVGGDILQETSPLVQPGELITILVDLDRSYSIGEDSQVKITSTNGAVVVTNIMMGQSSP